MVGRVRWTDHGTHDIRTVGWLAGSIVSAGGSGIVLSLQDVDATTGLPSRPDGTQDQTKAAYLNVLTAGAWNQLTLTTDRTIAHGAPLCVVWEFDGAGRLGADAMNIYSVPASLPDTGHHTILFTGTWADLTGQPPILVFVASDGTVGTLGLSIPFRAFTTHTFNSSSTPDEVANQFVLAAPATIDGITIPIAFIDGSDVSLVLYDGTTAVETLVIDEDVGPVLNTNARRVYFPFATPRDLEAGTVYRVGVQPSTTTSVSVYSFDVHAASYLDLYGGQVMHYWDRVNAGAWANENMTRCLLMSLHFSKAEAGGGGGGGLRLAGHGGLVS